MHPEIEEILINFDFDVPLPTPVMLQNAERILRYMDDIYVDRAEKLEYTAAESLYIKWDVEGLEFHMECLKNGLIRYTFRRNIYGKSFGCDSISQFMPRLEMFLLKGIF